MRAEAARRFEAVIFDMDGLLLDSERPIRAAWLAHTRVDAADYALTVGRNRRDSLAALAHRFASPAEAETMYERIDTMVEAQFSTHGIALMTGALALLQALRSRGIPLALASSTRHARVLQRLAAAGILEFFGPIHGGDQVARGKPHPDLFLLAAQSLGINPAKTLVFEDSSYGAQGALAAGCGVVLVPDLKAPEPEVAAQCLLLESLDAALPQLPDWF